VHYLDIMQDAFQARFGGSGQRTVRRLERHVGLTKMNQLGTLASLTSVLLALIAALLWAASATVNLPVLGSAWGAIHNLDAFYIAMKRVARLNAGAAFCAFASAMAQAIALYIS
jgi:hypothetical protein